MKKYFSIILILLNFIVFSCDNTSKADLVILGGKVVTMDADFSIKESVAAKDGKILFIGKNEGIEEYIDNNTKIIELNGAMVLPGLIDAHGHLTEYGKSLQNIDLVGTNSFEEVLNLVKNKIKAVDKNQWIQGQGWDQNDWAVKEFPSHKKLSEISPNNPVVLTRIDGHALLANQAAMDIAGIDSNTADPIGGKILHDDNGNPTGIFIDNAELLITKQIPKYSKSEIRRIIKNGAEELTEYGITGIHDAGIPINRIDDYKYLINNSEMPIRINAMIADTMIADINGFLNKYKNSSFGNDFLRIQSIKLFADGALGSRGAALLEPYSDDPDNSGLIVTDSLHLYNMVVAALQNDFQVCTHAIGDKGVRYILNIYENALEKFPKNDHRFRIEHSQIVNLQDIPRYAELGIIPSMQPQHAVSDMPWVEDRIGKERLAGAYAWHSFIEAGLIIPCGSDVPVEIPNPMIGIHDAVTRQNQFSEPEGGWLPDQKMTIEEVIKGYTIWAAKAAFQEDILGSIEVGKYADFTIIDQNIFELNPSQILKIEPLYTIVNGEIKFQKTIN